MVGFGTVVSHNMGAAAASSFALVLCCNGKSVVSVLTGWCAQRPSGRCAGSGPETAAFACSFSLVLWSGASLSHLGLERQRDKWLPFKLTQPKRTDQESDLHAKDYTKKRTKNPSIYPVFYCERKTVALLSLTDI